jgi:WD40 repeat protein
LYELPPLRSVGVKSLKFSPDNRYLVSGHIYKGFRVWDIKTKKLIQQVKGMGTGSDTVSQIEFSPDGTLLFSLDDGNKISIWKLQN